ncbi:hypothetical protein ACSLPB_26710, partial [Escherichia coli]
TSITLRPDRVAVFNNGRIEQVDSPRDLYMRPRTPFVAAWQWGEREEQAVKQLGTLIQERL